MGLSIMLRTHTAARNVADRFNMIGLLTNTVTMRTWVEQRFSAALSA
jgi:hypothetical protein